MIKLLESISNENQHSISENVANTVICIGTSEIGILYP